MKDCDLQETTIFHVPPPSSRLTEPPSPEQVVEDDRVAPVHEHELKVTAAQGAIGPPAVLDDPVLGDLVDRKAIDRARSAALANDHARGAGPGQTAKSLAQNPDRVSEWAGCGMPVARLAPGRGVEASPYTSDAE